MNSAQILWPNSARAAVSLTYDDSMQSQYEVAAPQLDQAGLRGTFFLNRVDFDAPWVALAKRGHELGAHTQSHPCPRATGASKKPSEDFERAELIAELESDLLQLERLGQARPFSFAYPCGVTWIGEQESYVPLIRERFSAARIASGTTSADEADPLLVPAEFNLKTVALLMAGVDRAVATGKWLVLGFHGVGGGWLSTESAVHQQFVQALSERTDVFVAPFGQVAAHIRGESVRAQLA